MNAYEARPAVSHWRAPPRLVGARCSCGLRPWPVVAGLEDAGARAAPRQTRNFKILTYILAAATGLVVLLTLLMIPRLRVAAACIKARRCRPKATPTRLHAIALTAVCRAAGGVPSGGPDADDPLLPAPAARAVLLPHHLVGLRRGLPLRLRHRAAGPRHWRLESHLHAQGARRAMEPEPEPKNGSSVCQQPGEWGKSYNLVAAAPCSLALPPAPRPAPRTAQPAARGAACSLNTWASITCSGCCGAQRRARPALSAG